MNGKAGGIYWFTGLSGSGKTTLSRAAAQILQDQGRRLLILDGDQLREGLCSDLGFSQADRRENIRRAGEVARLFSMQGLICLCAFITPYRAMREDLRQRLAPRYHEIFINCPLEECIARDPKRLYARARQDSANVYTGLGDPYEPPASPDLAVATHQLPVEESARRIAAFILDREDRR